jgi:hypothetical protein
MLQRTDEALEALEQAICENAGDLVRACHACGVNPRELHQWTLSDPGIAASIKTAQMIGWASLESEAYRRAVLGIDKAVYYKGEVVGVEKEYSDGLLQTLLKARVPGFSTDGEQGKGVTVNVNLMPRAATYEEWLEHKEEALKLIECQSDEGALVRNEASAASLTDQREPEDASFEEVSDAAKAAYVLMRQPGLRDVL